MRSTSYVEKLLASLDVRVRSFALCKIDHGFRLVLDPVDAPLIHYALKGPGVLQAHGGPALQFADHDFIVVPRGVAHSMLLPEGAVQDVRGVELISALGDTLLEMSAGRSAAGITVCGAIEAAYGGGIGLFDTLREPLLEHLTPDDPLRGAFEAMLSELSAPTIGTGALVEALLKQCLILLIRRQLHGAGGQTPWFVPTSDQRLAAALGAMLERPAAPHTVHGLAATAGMSRSAFAGRFTAVFGQSPMEFLRDLRLRHAARLLENTDLPIQAIAESVGYASRSYFARAFRAMFGTDPQRFRKTR